MAIAVAFAIPITFWTAERANDFAATERALAVEIRGNACLAHAYDLLRVVQNVDSPSAAPPRALDRAFERLEAERCAANPSEWSFLRARLRADAFAAAPRRGFGDSIVGVLNAIGDRSNLTYDSHPTTLNLGDVLAYALPGVRARLFAAAFAKTRVRAATLHALAAEGLATTDYDLKAAFVGRPDLRALLAERVRKANTSERAFAGLLEPWENGPTDAQPRRAALVAAMRSAIRDTDLAFNAIDAALERELLSERAAIRSRMPLFWSLFAGELIAAALLAWFIAMTMLHRERRILLHLRDETARLQAEVARDRAQLELGIREARFRAIFEGSPLAIAITDRDGTIVESNEAYQRFVGGVVANERRELFHALAVEPSEALPAIFSTLRTSLADTQASDLLVTRRDGSRVWCHAVVSIVREGSGPPAHFTVMLADVTERKDREHRFQHDATHDYLTGLPNRSFAVATLQRHLEKDPVAGPRFAVLFIDVDDFKSINDTLGHRAGDECLRAVGERLTSLVREGDIVTRYGGDEFIVLLSDPVSVSDACDIDERIAHAFLEPVTVGDAAITLFLSVGLMVDRLGCESAEQVLRDADGAMYGDKLHGRKRFTKIERLSEAENRAERTENALLARSTSQYGKSG